VTEAWTVLLILALSAALAAIAAVAASRRAMAERRRADELRRQAAELRLRAQLAKRGAEIQSENAAELRRRIERMTGRDPSEPDDALLGLSPLELRRALRRSNEDYLKLMTRQLADEATHERRLRELLERIQEQGKLITSLVEALAETTSELERTAGGRRRTSWRGGRREERNGEDVEDARDRDAV
jgi:uncharacterized coiled-coil protein SlyX